MALAAERGMSQFKQLGSVARAFAATALLGLASGCYAEAGAEPEYVDADAPPAAIASAPHYDYGGRTVYYVNDHWYAQDRGHWRYYRNEPQPLVRQRTHVQEAPRARDERRVARPRVEAPRAERVQ
jgi:hypothetical protein